MELNLTPEQQQLVRALTRETFRILQEEAVPTNEQLVPPVAPMAYGSLPATVYNHLLDLHQRNEAEQMLRDSNRMRMNSVAYPMAPRDFTGSHHY